MKNECLAIVLDGKESGIGPFNESTCHLSIKFVRETQFPASVCNAINLRTLLTSKARHVVLIVSYPIYSSI